MDVRTGFDNPTLQKHYSTMQAMALQSDDVEWTEEMDNLVPDMDAMTSDKIAPLLRDFCRW